MTGICISDLKHRMRMEAPSRIEDGGGGGSVTWQLVAEFWAGMQQLSGREGLEAGALYARATHDVVCRYRDDVSLTYRLVLNGRVFEIRGVTNINDEGRFLKLRCEEMVT